MPSTAAPTWRSLEAVITRRASVMAVARKRRRRYIGAELVDGNGSGRAGWIPAHAW